MEVKTSNKISLAVLPFKNGNKDESLDYICDGITEEIIFALARIDQLKVISKTSSFFFKGTTASIEEIGKQLEVSTLLEGTIRTHNDSIRISAQLINVEDNTYLWSETWTRKMENLFELQDEISLSIADTLRENLGHFNISDHLLEGNHHDAKAYTHYLKGRHHFLKWNPEDVHIAIQEFEKAISLDDTIIEAHLGIADTYSFLAVAGFAPRMDAWKKADDALKKAQSIDEDHAGLNYLLANQAFFTKGDFQQAMQFSLKALQRSPTDAENHRFMSFLYLISGKFRKAKEHIHYARSIDPLNQETLFHEANYAYRTGADEVAEHLTNKLLAQNDKNLPALIVSIYLKLKHKKGKAAKTQIEAAPPELLTPDERLGLLCLAEIVSGNANNKELALLEDHAKEYTAHHAHSHLFTAYSMLGEFEKAYELLSYFFEHQSSILLLSFSDPLSAAIRETNQYEDFHKRIYPSINPLKQITPKKPATLEQTDWKEDLEKLEVYMAAEKPYLNPTLSLRLLAANIDIHPNQLSWLINNGIGKNFNEYVNLKRIEHFKKLVIDPKNSHISLIGLAYESGFNSKSVFNTTFKKEVGLTPKAYQKAHTTSK